MRYHVLGTAGHVDHGKTALVQAMTGVNTDRLPEEAERGLTIELGFAPLRLSEETLLGIVDVPGHERFIKTMVAGVAGIDLVMLLVAADEGVKPQTIEHLDVCRLLEVPRGLVVLSKCDLVDDELIELVGEEVDDLCKGSFLEGAPRVATSATDGRGIDRLRSILLELVSSIPEREPGGVFRLPVDRVFTRQGLGTIVTGTAWAGRVRKGDVLEVLPERRSVRVREVQTFGSSVEEGVRGQRIALALHGIKPGEIVRGDQVLSPGILQASFLLDLHVEMMAEGERGLANRERVRFHHGTRELLGRIILLDRETLDPGESSLAQIRLESPCVADAGDGFVIRRYSPPRVLAGGRVLEPSAEKHKRFDESKLTELALLAEGSSEEHARAVLKRAGKMGISRRDLPRDAQGLETLLASGGVTRVGERFYLSESLLDLARSIVESLQAGLAAAKLAWGLDREEVRRRVEFAGSAEEFSEILERMSKKGVLEFRGPLLRPASTPFEIDSQDRAVLDEITAYFRAQGFRFPSTEEVRGVVRDRIDPGPYLRFLREEGVLVPVAGESHLHASAYEELIEQVRSHFGDKDDLTVGELKSRLGLSRKYVVPLLELLDDHGITVRKGDFRSPGAALETE